MYFKHTLMSSLVSSQAISHLSLVEICQCRRFKKIIEKILMMICKVLVLMVQIGIQQKLEEWSLNNLWIIWLNSSVNNKHLTDTKCLRTTVINYTMMMMVKIKWLLSYARVDFHIRTQHRNLLTYIMLGNLGKLTNNENFNNIKIKKLKINLQSVFI